MVRRGLGRWVRFVGVILACTVIGGCSQSSLAPEAVDLSDVVAAIPLYELSDSQKNRSQIALIHTDGSYEMLSGAASDSSGRRNAFRAREVLHT